MKYQNYIRGLQWGGADVSKMTGSGAAVVAAGSAAGSADGIAGAHRRMAYSGSGVGPRNHRYRYSLVSAGEAYP